MLTKGLDEDQKKRTDTGAMIEKLIGGNDYEQRMKERDKIMSQEQNIDAFAHQLCRSVKDHQADRHGDQGIRQVPLPGEHRDSGEDGPHQRTGDDETAKIGALGDAIGLDTESDSLYHHRDKVCLVQLATDRGAAFLLDSLGQPIFPKHIDIVEDLGADAFCYGTVETAHGTQNVVARGDGRTPPRRGDTIHLTIAGGHAHVFDPNTGVRIGK